MNIIVAIGELSRSPTSEEEAARKTARPGILVFSHTMQLLHVNRRALELTGHCDRAETGPVRVTFSTPVIELRAKVQESLNARAGLGIWGTFEVRSVLCEAGLRVRLRGFGLPDRNFGHRLRIVILLEEDLGERPQPRLADSHQAVTYHPIERQVLRTVS